MRLSIEDLLIFCYENEFGILIQYHLVIFSVAVATWNGFGHSIVLCINISSLDSFISSSFLHWFLVLSIIIPSLSFIG